MGEDATYNDINQFGNMPVGERFEDVDFALEILNKLRGEIATTDGLDCDFMTRLLTIRCIINTQVGEKTRDSDALRCNPYRRSQSFPSQGH
jgi:hypothetical protein